jgi:hypothetical protein
LKRESPANEARARATACRPLSTMVSGDIGREECGMIGWDVGPGGWPTHGYLSFNPMAGRKNVTGSNIDKLAE